MSGVRPASPTSGASRSAPGAPTRLHRALARILRARRPDAELVGVEVRPRPCRSSWAVEDLVLELEGGERISLVWKDLGRERPGSRAATVKPASVRDPAREPRVYREILAEGDAPPCWGVEVDEEDGIHWLFLEPVEGTPLCETGDRSAWWAAAAWLGAFHRRHAADPLDHAGLLRHDAGLHRSWYRRALDRVSPGEERVLRSLGPAHERALERVFDRAPTTLLHGEFYPANVLVAEGPGAPRIVPVDWETAGPGPGVLDLAALTTGSWSGAERSGFLEAYRRGSGADGPVPVPRLRAAGLLLAFQWLGWSDGGWDPPPELRHDWLEEAVRTAEQMES